MKFQRFYLFALVAILALTPTVASAVGLGATLHDGDFGVQARHTFVLGGDISEFTGGASLFFDNTWFAFDADYHFLINPENPSRFYPLAGVDFATDFKWTEFGVNLGAGMDFMFTDTLAGYVEGKFVVWGANGFVITAGVKF